MIKILKDGVIPKQFKTIFKATCKHCNCEFEFEEDDCKNYLESTELNHGALIVNCPCCKSNQFYYIDSLQFRKVEV